MRNISVGFAVLGFEVASFVKGAVTEGGCWACSDLSVGVVSGKGDSVREGGVTAVAS